MDSVVSRIGLALPIRSYVYQITKVGPTMKRGTCGIPFSLPFKCQCGDLEIFLTSTQVGTGVSGHHTYV